MVLVGTSMGSGLRTATADALLTAGVCALKLELTATTGTVPARPPVPPEPLVEHSWSVVGSGWCLVDAPDIKAGATVSGTLSGPADLASVGCAVAVLDGLLTLSVDAPGYGSMTGGVLAVVAGEAVALSITSLPFVAVGAFAQGPLDMAACVLGGATTMTWWGVLPFANPTV